MSGIRYENFPPEIIEQIASYGSSRDLAKLEVADAANNSVYQAAKERAKNRDAAKIQAAIKGQTDRRYYNFFKEIKDRGVMIPSLYFPNLPVPGNVKPIIGRWIRRGLSEKSRGDLRKWGHAIVKHPDAKIRMQERWRQRAKQILIEHDLNPRREALRRQMQEFRQRRESGNLLRR